MKLNGFDSEKAKIEFMRAYKKYVRFGSETEIDKDVSIFLKRVENALWEKNH